MISDSSASARIDPKYDMGLIALQSPRKRPDQSAVPSLANVARGLPVQTTSAKYVEAD